MAACSDRAAASTSECEEYRHDHHDAITPHSVVSATTNTADIARRTALGSTRDATLAGNFQTFLTLLTTQLQNQNPLDPLDTNQFTAAAGAVRRRRAAAQDRTTSSPAGHACNRPRRRPRRWASSARPRLVDGTPRPLTNSSATWHSERADATPRQHHHRQCQRPDRVHRQIHRRCRAPTSFTWNGKGNDGTQWPDGKYTITATGKDVASNNVGDRQRRCRACVDSVDLTQSPPLLTIDGQSYTPTRSRAWCDPALKLGQLNCLNVN